MPKIDTRVTDLERRAALHDREVAAIRKLFIQGAKILVKLEQRQVEAEQRQARTEKALNRLIHSMERGGTNGHNGKQ